MSTPLPSPVPPTSGFPSRKPRQGAIASYLILNITSGTVAGALQVVVPLYALSLNAAAGQIGLIRGISGLGILLLVIPAGFLVDHYGSKRLFLLGGLCSTVAILSLSWARTPEAMVAIMGLAGLFNPLKMTALNASFFNNLQKMGLEKAGWFKGSMSIGLTFLGPLLGGTLVGFVGYPPLFRLLAVGTLIPIGLVFFFHHEPSRAAHGKSLREAIAGQFAEFRTLLRQRSLYLPLVTESISTAFFAAFSAFIFVLAVRNLGLKATDASLLLGIEGGVFIVTVFSAGPLITRLTQLQLYLLSMATALVGLIPLTLSATFAGLAFASVILGLGLGLINLVVSSGIGRLHGTKGKTVGLFSAAVGIGISVGPMAGGVLAQKFGIDAAFLLFAPLFLGLAAAALWLDRRAQARAKVSQVHLSSAIDNRSGKEVSSLN